MKVERRAIGGVPWQPWTDPFMRFDVGGPAHPTRQVFGVEKALGLTALYAGTKILSDNVASLPVKVLQSVNGGRSIPYTGPHLFQGPSSFESPFDWMCTCMSSLLLWGNAWGLVIGRDAYGFPKQIEWIPPERIIVEQEDPGVTLNPLSTNVYAAGRKMSWHGPDAELFHIKGLGLPGRLEGVSPLMKHALTILAGIEAQRYGTDWYASGGFPPGTFQNSELEVDAEQAAQIRKMLVTSLRRREPLVYGRDWDYTPVTVPPSEAQFLDAMGYNATQIAVIFDLPANRLGGKSGDSLTYSTVEQNQIQVIEAMRSWLCRLESAFNPLLPVRRTVNFNTNVLLKTDLKTQAQIDWGDRDAGIRTTDEIRDQRGMAPLPGGVGSETLPLQLVVSMGQRAGALPKLMMPQVSLLIDIAGKKLEDLQKKGLTKDPVGGEFQADPQTGQPSGPANDPGQFYSNMLNAYSRMAQEAGLTEFSAWLRDPQIHAKFIPLLIEEVRLQREIAMEHAPRMRNAGVLDMIENYDDIPPTGLND
jgi:HK97 family phage portal protein